jgi:hypothetical protein
MPKIQKRTVPIRTEKEIEDMYARLDKQAGLIDYLAIMADIDIPDDEVEGGYEQELSED